MIGSSLMLPLKWDTSLPFPIGGDTITSASLQCLEPNIFPWFICESASQLYCLGRDGSVIVQSNLGSLIQAVF